MDDARVVALEVGDNDLQVTAGDVSTDEQCQVTLVAVALADRPDGEPHRVQDGFVRESVLARAVENSHLDNMPCLG